MQEISTEVFEAPKMEAKHFAKYGTSSSAVSCVARHRSASDLPMLTLYVSSISPSSLWMDIHVGVGTSHARANSCSSALFRSPCPSFTAVIDVATMLNASSSRLRSCG